MSKLRVANRKSIKLGAAVQSPINLERAWEREAFEAELDHAKALAAKEVGVLITCVAR